MKSLRFFNRFALMSAAMLLFVTACDDDDTPTPTPPTPPTPPTEETLVTAIELEPTSAELVQEETLQLKATFSPADATNLNETEWEVRNPNIASVSNDGLVTAKEVGETVITCKVGKVAATCTLKVTEKQMEKANFEVEVVELGATQVKFNIIPKNKDAYYFCDVIPVSTLNCENVGGIKNIAKKDREWWEMVTNSKDPNVWIKTFGHKGDLKYDSQSNETGSGIDCMFWGMDYMLYIYEMDENAMPSTEVMEVPFKTAHHRDSENKISVEIVETFSENIHAKITTTNDDPWFFIIESKKYWDSVQENPTYPELGPKESFAADMLIRNLDMSFLFQHGNYEITPDTPILPQKLRPNRDYVLVIFGFDRAKGSTTEICVTPFKTQPRA